MANPTSVGEQLLRQRPDLVRRTWVPILVRETYASGVKDHSENFQNFIQFGGQRLPKELTSSLIVIFAMVSRLEKLSVVPRPHGLEAQDPIGEVFHSSCSDTMFYDTSFVNNQMSGLDWTVSVANLEV